jgi:integrase
VVKRSKQPRIRLHDLRHTHATLMLQAGVHIKVVRVQPDMSHRVRPDMSFACTS